MEGLIFQLFFVIPLVRWLIHKDRPWNKKSSTTGLCFACVIILITSIYQLRRNEYNYFEDLSLPANSSVREVQAAYRKLALKYHPDKTDDPNAVTIYEKIRLANETLSNENTRNQYIRFGDYIKLGDITEDNYLDFLLVAILHSMIPLFFGYVYTYDDELNWVRKFYIAVIGFSFSCEIYCRFSDEAQDFLWWFPYLNRLVSFEKIEFFHNLVPILLNSLLVLGAEFHFCLNELQEEVGKLILENQISLTSKIDLFLKELEKSTRIVTTAKLIDDYTPKGKELSIPDNINVKVDNMMKIENETDEEFFNTLKINGNFPNHFNILNEIPPNGITNENWLKYYIRPLDKKLKNMEYFDSPNWLRGGNLISTIILFLSIWQMIFGNTGETSNYITKSTNSSKNTKNSSNTKNKKNFTKQKKYKV